MCPFHYITLFSVHKIWEGGTYDYDAYGKEINPDPNDTNPFRYCGEYYDTESGQLYLRNRYYNSGIPRFMTPDSYWNVSNMIYGDNGIPSISSIMQSSNLYVYCGANPINKFDPTGEYDRHKAMEFAYQYYDEEEYRRNYPFFAQNCANFVSYCLWAGGLHMSDDWYNYRMIEVFGKGVGQYSLSWTVAREQYRILSDPARGYTSGKEIIWFINDIKYHAQNSGIQQGDLLYFCHKEGDVYHAAIIVEVTEDEIYFSAHTRERNHTKLSDVYDGNPIVILKMRDDA